MVILTVNIDLILLPIDKLYCLPITPKPFVCSRMSYIVNRSVDNNCDVLMKDSVNVRNENGRAGRSFVFERCKMSD